MDKLDQRIISALAEDGRRSYRDIARDLNVSEASIRQRVSRLTSDDLIRITAVGNLQALGFDVVAMVHFKVLPSRIEEYAQLISEYSAVRFVSISLGNADIIFQSLHTSIPSLHDFVRNELPRRMPDIIATEIFPLVKTLKSSWTWEAWFDLQNQNS
ncbi:Lrp/AsnC family transcriptional regulator [Microvirga antarctica]|uniref:Lrp/AsnC family transcriptional regulator n=1 Tax=Microvirga antarctica TaxID=2819233 RepID=UPI001B3129C6|nr:Lrp/AsnC family transcriptional regulator [Microvirga antarctica]